jgi:hypothetical protein
VDCVKPVLLLKRLESQEMERWKVGESGDLGISCEVKITVVLGGRMLWYFSQPENNKI